MVFNQNGKINHLRAEMNRKIADAQEHAVSEILKDYPLLIRSADGTMFTSPVDSRQNPMVCNFDNVRTYVQGRLYKNFINTQPSTFAKYQVHHLIEHNETHMLCKLSNTLKRKDHNILEQYLDGPEYAR